MTNLGNVDLGDTVRIKTVLTNISSVIADASEIRLSILDPSNVKKINQSNMTHTATGTYSQDIYINPVLFDAGLHYAILSGSTVNISRNASFYHLDTFYIEKNRLV